MRLTRQLPVKRRQQGSRSRFRILGCFGLSHVCVPILCATILGSLAGCANCRTSNKTSTTVVNRQARRQLRNQISASNGGMLNDAVVEERLRRVKNHLLRDTASARDKFAKLQLHVLNTDKRDALVIPGHLFVTKGLYDRLATDDQLAAVISHELGHLDKGHCIVRPGALAGPSLKREMEADAFATHLLSRAGYDPLALRDVLHELDSNRDVAWTARRVARISDLSRQTAHPL